MKARNFIETYDEMTEKIPEKFEKIYELSKNGKSSMVETYLVETNLEKIVIYLMI